MKTRNHNITIWILLVTLLAVVYFPSLSGPYILDDSHTIQSNVAIQNLANLGRLWTSAKFYSSSPDNWGYRPVTTTANALCWAVGGGSTWPFHLLKIVVFATFCSVLVQIWRRLLPQADQTTVVAAILLFAVSPAHTQVVSYISATSSLLAGLFVALAVLGFLRFREGLGAKWLLLAVLSTVLGTFAKEEGIVVLALIPLIELYLRRIEGQSLFAKLPWPAFLAVALAGVVAVGIVFHMFESTSNIARGDVTRLNYFLTQWRAYLRYLRMLWLPIDLNADNLEFGFSTSLLDRNVILAGLANLALIGFAIFQWRVRPVLLLALAWFYIGVSPSSSVIALAEPVNDHRSFIAYMGLGLLFVPLLSTARRYSQRLYTTVVIVGLALYSSASAYRNQLWGNNEMLWRDTVIKNPSSPRALNNLAVDLMSQARYQESIELLTKCYEVGAQYGICRINRAVTHAALGNDEQAEADFRLAVALDRTYLSSRLHWATFLRIRGYWTRASDLLREADAFTQGQNFQVRRDLIDLASQMGNLSEAGRLLKESRERFGDHPELVRLGRSHGLITE